MKLNESSERNVKPNWGWDGFTLVRGKGEDANENQVCEEDVATGCSENMMILQICCRCVWVVVPFLSSFRFASTKPSRLGPKWKTINPSSHSITLDHANTRCSHHLSPLRSYSNSVVVVSNLFRGFCCFSVRWKVGFRSWVHSIRIEIIWITHSGWIK